MCHWTTDPDPDPEHANIKKTDSTVLLMLDTAIVPGTGRLGRRVQPLPRRYAWDRRQLPRNRRHRRIRRPNRPGHRRPTRNRLHSHDMYIDLDEGVVGSGMGLFLIVGHCWPKILPQNSKGAS